MSIVKTSGIDYESSEAKFIKLERQFYNRDKICCESMDSYDDMSECGRDSYDKDLFETYYDMLPVNYSSDDENDYLDYIEFIGRN